MIKNILVCFVFLMVAACSDDRETPIENTDTSMVWTCYTHSTCDGQTVNQTREVCTRATEHDTLVDGDAMIGDWQLLWKAACQLNEGVVTDSEVNYVGRSCTTAAGQPSTWGCSVECYPEYRSCN